MSRYSSILIITFSILLAWGIGLLPKHVSAEETCAVTDAIFTPYTLPGRPESGFFAEATPPQVKITITTENCQGKELSVRVMEGTDISRAAISIPRLPEKFTVPENNSFSITLKAGETGCSVFAEPECSYRILAGLAGTAQNTFYDSRDKHRGNLDYDCSGYSCNFAWEYISDTSARPTSSVSLEDGGGFAGDNSACIASGIPDCYQTYEGFQEISAAFGNKISFLSLGDDASIASFINLIIQIATGIAGLILVVRIFYLGFAYMTEKKDGNPVKMDYVKGQIFKAVIGFILLLSIYIILRTINPDLLVLTPRIDASTLLEVPDRVADPLFNETINSLDASTVEDANDFTDTTFLMYLYHQQGEGGAPSILWSAKKGYSEVPSTTPFIKNKGKNNASIINRNMERNINKTDMQRVIGTTEITPLNFLRYWRKKVEAAKKSTKPLPQEILTALSQVSQETGVNIEILTAMCRIESGCTTSGITVVNSEGYAGLFQLSNKLYPNSKGAYRKTNGVWETYKKPNGILLDAYHNSYVGAKYGLYNVQKYRSQLDKINN